MKLVSHDVLLMQSLLCTDFLVNVFIFTSFYDNCSYYFLEIIDLVTLYLYNFFFFKQMTAYEFRISDWSSDVCSSDLYFMILAAIPAVFGFIKGSLIGHSLFGVTVTTSILSGLVAMVFSYVLSLVMLYVVALIINALAPTFGGQKDQLQAVKVIGYAWTAAWVAGIATIVP